MRCIGKQSLFVCGLLSLLSLATSNGGALLGQEAAQKLELAQSSLAIAPQDAAFFSSSLNLRESWQAFMASDFMTELRQIPYVQKVVEHVQGELDSPTGQGATVKRVMNDPNVQNLIRLAKEMFTDEVFFIGGHEWCKFADGLSDLQNEITEAAAEGEEAIIKYVMELDQKKIAGIPVPNTIVGFKLTSDEIARLQLDALEGILRIAGSANPQIKPLLAGLKRSDLKNGQVLTFSVGTDSIPWESLPLDQMEEEKRKVFDHVVELFEGRHISLSVGVIDNRLMLAISENPEVLSGLGGNGEKLLNHERLRTLVDAPPKDLRSVAYASADWRDAGYRMNFEKYFRRLANQAIPGIKKELDDDAKSDKWIGEILEDADWLDGKLAEMASKFGAQVTYSFAIEDGLEGRAYDWSDNQFLVNAKPLSVIRHAGKNSLLMFALKQKWPRQLREVCETIIKRAPAHVKHLLESGLLDEEESKKFEAAANKFWPLLDEGLQILRDKIGPSLGEHESIFSIAAQWTTNGLGDELPQSDEPLPLPEVGGACLLKNKDLFINGCDEMLQLMDKVVELVREVEPDSIPAAYKIPRPDQEQLAGGTRYFYDIPAEDIPLQGMQLQLVVGEDTVAFGYSTRQVRDMFDSKPLSTRPAWLGADTPAAAVAYVDFAGICAALKPWIRLGLVSTAGDLEEPLQIPNDFPAPTGAEVLRIWDCLHCLGRTTGTTVIQDDGTSFSRWVWVGK